MNKITIIGSGRVGSTIAYSLTCRGMASKIVIIDINNERALGEAMDIRQGLPYDASCSIYAGSYADAVDSDIVIITSGIARQPGQSRLDLININIGIQKSIIPQITAYAPNAVYIIVSNPVDILTYAFCKLSGIPENRIIGSGTILDTSRLRARISEYCNVDPENVNAYVLGEHGDSEFIPWSVANVAGVPLDEYTSSLIGRKGIATPLDKEEITSYVRGSGSRIISRKGATFYAVSSAVCYICKAVLSDSNTVMPVSSMMNGEYGISDVCLSSLCVVGKNGINGKLGIKLTDEEIEKYRNSAEVLKKVIAQSEF